MSEDNKSVLAPRLRFPEFRDAAGWKVEQLDGLISTVTPPKKIPTTEYLAKGQFPIIDQGQSDIAGWTDDPDSLVKENEPLIIFGDHTCALKLARSSFAQGADGIKVLKGNGPATTEFLYQHLCFRPVLPEEYKRHFSILRDKVIAYPEARSGEQQKIADCLSSIDELITAETQKLDVLKTHKKGLMQQLFPREGETVPRLRFSEFRGDSHTGFKTIDELAKVTTGGRDTQNKVDDGQYPFFVRSQSVERIDSYSYDGEAVLTSGDGVGVGENYHYIDGRFDFHQRVYCICDFNDSVSGRFFFHYFSLHFKKRVKQMSAKNSVDSVRMPMITEMPIWLPAIGEQERIADCLSSLDDLISVQSQKIDALKTHKKGLMQQLFPVLDEVSA